MKRSYPPAPESGEVSEDEDSDEDIDDDEESGNESTRVGEEWEEEDEDADEDAFVFSRRGGSSNILRDTASSSSGTRGGRNGAGKGPAAHVDPKPSARLKRSFVFVESDEDFSV